MKYLAGAITGGIMGYAYYKIIGCPTGTCPITRNPWSSTIYGMIMGLLIAGK